jgi:hypothetical protein
MQNKLNNNNQIKKNNKKMKYHLKNMNKKNNK